MEESPRSPSRTESPMEAEERGRRNEFCAKYNLTVIREERVSGVLAVVVDSGYGDGKEIRIGFPDGIIHGLAATDKIKGVPMGMYGHGMWRRSIL